MINAQVADIFRSIAQLLEIKGDNPFRIRAYARAADRIAAMQEDIAAYAREGRLEELEGVGKDLAAKIGEIIATGTCRHYEEIKKSVPQGVVDMLAVPGIGPKTAKLFYDELDIRSISALRRAAQQGRLKGLPGVQQKTVENILEGIALVEKGQERMDILTAGRVATAVADGLKDFKSVKSIGPAGSLRRGRETVRDIDILAASLRPAEVMEKFVSLPFVKRVLAHGATKSAVLTDEDIQVDLRVLAPRAFGAALLYFTGSKAHNIKLRQLAVRKKLKINEYGLFDMKEACLASRTEAEIYAALGMDFIPPELREDRGEIEAALAHRLPRLVELRDIRGDFHAHTNYSDGRHTPEEMAAAAQRLGYEYLCLTDHSVSLKVARGLDRKRLKEKKAHLDKLNKKLKGFRVLFATEAEIDAEGRIDYPSDLLRTFDVVVAAIHSGFRQSREQLTRRIVRACQNPDVHIIAHPTGRQWPGRPSYDVDFEEIFKAARETNTALEINAQPARMDLGDGLARAAKEAGVRLAVGTDAHDRAHLAYMPFGVGLARRAWLEKKDLLNTQPLERLLQTIEK